MMIEAIKPHGLIISENAIQYRKEEDGKYYAVDKGYNKLEISKADYMKLTCPIRKFEKKERLENESD